MEGWAPFESEGDRLTRFGVGVGKCKTNESSKEICTKMITSSRSRMWHKLKLDVMMMILSLQMQCTHMNDINEASFLIPLTTGQFTSFGQLHSNSSLLHAVCRYAGRCRQNKSASAYAFLRKILRLLRHICHFSFHRGCWKLG